MSDIRIIAAFVIPLIFMFICIKKKITPALFLLGAAVLSALIGGIPLSEIPTSIASSFGTIMTNSALIIIFGIMFGELLDASGGLGAFLTRLVKRTGANGSIFAVYLFGYVISIPIGFTASMAVGCPMLKPLSEKTKKPLVSYATAYIGSSFTTSCMVVPTLTPVLVCGIVGAEMGWVFIYGLIVSLIATLVGALAFAFFLGKRYGSIQKEEDFHEDIEMLEVPKDAPSNAAVLGLIILPIILILFGVLAPYMFAAESAIVSVATFIGTPSFALLISILAEFLVLFKYIKNPMAVVEKAVGKCGFNLVVTGFANGFGTILTAVGMGTLLTKYTSNLQISVLVLAFLVTLLLRSGAGVMTVAATTVAPLFLNLVTTTGTSPVLYVLAICLGCIGLAIPTDSAFWIYKEFTKMDTKETLISFTAAGSIVAAVGFAILMLLNAAAPMLPGLM